MNDTDAREHDRVPLTEKLARTRALRRLFGGVTLVPVRGEERAVEGATASVEAGPGDRRRG